MNGVVDLYLPDDLSVQDEVWEKWAKVSKWLRSMTDIPGGFIKGRQTIAIKDNVVYLQGWLHKEGKVVWNKDIVEETEYSFPMTSDPKDYDVEVILS